VTTVPSLLFVVSGPSGAGKDTLVAALRERLPRLRYSISATTRPPRTGEREGEHYFFLSAQEFERRRSGGGFLEFREYNGNLYGTPRDYVERMLAEGFDVIVKPEVNGALAVKQAYPASILIFLMPERFSHLRERLLARQTETDAEIAGRLEIAHAEMKFVRNFDYIVVNAQGHSEDAVLDMQAILQAEHHRIARYTDDSIERVETS
jgi:guanylate kinase